MNQTAFKSFIFISALLAIITDFFEINLLFYFLKPLTTSLIILFLLKHRDTAAKAYSNLVIIGLLFCLGGDTFLLFPDFFALGLGAFLIGHLWFIAAFVKENGWKFPIKIGIPLAVYSTFYLEEKYGFNKTTTKTFVQDLIKSLLISIIFSSILYAVVISIIERLGDNWWIYAFVAVFLFQAIIFYLYPVLILPLFNKLEPITDEKFKEPIEKLLNKINFKAKGLFVMDGSLRSSHGNAFFTGFGNNKRIVFYDTLLETITPKEMESILGHELGHYKLGHIKRTLISSIFFGFLGFYILGQVFMADQFFYGHGLDEITLYSKFLLFYLVIGSYTFFTKPFTSYISRQREFAADDFSIEYTEVESMISGLLKLSKDNSSNLTPDNLYSSYYYSHPPIAERVKSLEGKKDLGNTKDE